MSAPISSALTQIQIDKDQRVGYVAGLQAEVARETAELSRLENTTVPTRIEDVPLKLH